MCLTITVSESGRRLMGLTTTVINVMLLFLGMALLVAALFLRFNLNSRIDFLDDYDPGALSFFLMFTAVVMYACHLAAMKFCYEATYAETRSEKHHLFVAMILVLMGIFLFTFICIIVVLVHGSRIRDAFAVGISKSLKSYRGDVATKERIDKLQLQIECCGVNSYKDWFEISWVNLVYLNVNSQEVKDHIHDGGYIWKDVPFSCCDKYSKRNCIHHSVGDRGDHKGNTDITLYRTGCVDKIMVYFDNILIVPTTTLLVVILILQATVIIVMRLLQTSILTADELNDPEGESAAYCLKGWGGGKDNRDYFKRKRLPADDVSSEDDDSDEEEAPQKRFKKRKTIQDKDDESDTDDDGGGLVKSSRGSRRRKRDDEDEDGDDNDDAKDYKYKKKDKSNDDRNKTTNKDSKERRRDHDKDRRKGREEDDTEEDDRKKNKKNGQRDKTSKKKSKEGKRGANKEKEGKRGTGKDKKKTGRDEKDKKETDKEKRRKKGKEDDRRVEKRSVERDKNKKKTEAKPKKPKKPKKVKTSKTSKKKGGGRRKGGKK